MTSHLLLEGTFDVKDPKGSGDRKFWKAWRRLCASFFVVYPPGRREPFLQLNFSQSSLEILEKEKVSRDGLRLFRCRSKSRPYRTWAIASGSKVVSYFAAENETQCQDSMQAVRDGMWPACFSFQMLTACSHEVSLIDDDNTFLSGLLGVYGRFVLTSHDVLSLMHPHWGATLLQISLNSVKDVLLVRQTEGPAGVFKIVLKRMEGSKIKAFQFFCNTCNEAIEWILSNTKNIEDNEEASEKKKSISTKYPKVKTKTKYMKIKKNFLNSNLSFPTEVPSKPYNNTSNDYENIQYLKRNIALDKELFIGTNTNILTHTKHESEISGSSGNNVFPKISMENESNTMININENNGTENKSSNLKTNENIYENIIHSTYSSALTTSSFSSCDSDHENECKKISNEKQLITNSRLKLSNDSLDTIEYAIVNKNDIKTYHNGTLDTVSASNPISINAEYNDKAKLISETGEVDDNKTDMNLFSKWNTIETESSFNSTIISEKSADPIFGPGNIKISNLPSSGKAMMLKAACDSQSLIYDNVDKNFSKHGQNDQLLINSSTKDYRNNETGNSCLPPNLPSEFLDTSIFARSNSDTTSRSFLHEEDNVSMSWATDEHRNSIFNDSVYEDILDRKGTVYEEIDSSDDEYTAPLPPDLPKRPQNLDIPDSLRLQKLSKNIEQTLKVMDEAKPITKEHPKLNLVKKIKDVKRIMQISPNSEYAKKTFETETKLPVNGKNSKSLNPFPVNSYVIANKN